MGCFGYHAQDAEGDIALDFRTGIKVCFFVATLMLSKGRSKLRAQSGTRMRKRMRRKKIRNPIMHYTWYCNDYHEQGHWY